MEAIAGELGVPLRGRSDAIRFHWGFYGQTLTGDPRPEGITVESLVNQLAALEHVATEIGCHPARAIDFDSSYSDERLVELETLCSPEVVAAVARFLQSFADLPA